LAPEVPKQNTNAYDDYKNDAVETVDRDTKDPQIEVSGQSQSRTVGKDVAAKSKEYAQRGKDSTKKEPVGRQAGKVRATRGRGRHAISTRAKQEVATRRQDTSPPAKQAPVKMTKESPPRRKETVSQDKEVGSFSPERLARACNN
jgi:hypothetical protein